MQVSQTLLDPKIRADLMRIPVSALKFKKPGLYHLSDL